MQQDIARFSRGEFLILRQLATYRYLTTNHMLRLGISNSRRYLYKLLKNLTSSKKNPVGILDFGAIPTIGRLHNMYYLTEFGASLLEDAGLEPETIKWPSKVRIFGHDYFHRINCIDFQINLNLWAKTNNAKINYFDTYYDYGKLGTDGRAHPRTRIAWETGQIIPDAVFSFTPEDGKERMCIFEMHNGVSAGRLIKQLKIYKKALSGRTAETIYNFAKNARLLLVFDEPKCLTRVQQLAIKNAAIEGREKQVFLKHLVKDQNTFSQEWKTLHDSEVNLF